MRIAITTAGKTLDDEIESRFGRTPNFLIVDTAQDNTILINNDQALDSVNGAGIQSAERVVRLDADVVLTGHVGPKAFKTLSAAGVSVVTGVKGTARQAYLDYLSGMYGISKSADVESHW